jgi:hypothetical protein
MRKALNLIWHRNLLAAAALAIVVTPQFLRADPGTRQCPMQNATMQGTYVATGTGTLTTVMGNVPITVVSLVVYNGDGSGQAISGTTVVNGASSVSGTAPATFTVNLDCTGQKTIGTTHFNFIITPDGNTIHWIVTDNGVTMSGTGVRQGR